MIPNPADFKPPVEQCMSLPEDPSVWVIERVVFDFGGVLVKPDEERNAAYLAEKLGVMPEEIIAYDVEINGNEKRKLQWIRVDDQEFAMWMGFAQSLGKTIDDPETWRQDYEEAKKSAVQPLPGMVEVIKELKEAGYPLDILSNFEPWMQPLLDRFLNELQEEMGGPSFDQIHLSYVTGKNKPDPQAYEAILKAAAGHTLFIDDQSKNITAAQECGLRALHFTTADQLRQELVSRRIL